MGTFTKNYPESPEYIDIFADFLLKCLCMKLIAPFRDSEDFS